MQLKSINLFNDLIYLNYVVYTCFILLNISSPFAQIVGLL